MPKSLIALLAALLLVGAMSSTATDATAAPNAPQQVFLTNSSQLTFIDLLTGSATPVAVNGDHFTVVHNNVMYYDRARRRVLVASPDGSVTPHRFIQPPEGGSVTRIDWHVSQDEQTIAWTETSGDSSALVTTTYVAGIDGEDMRQVFSDGPRDGIRAYPVAFNDDKSILYMDYQPDSIGDLTPFRQYAGLFMLDLLSGQTQSLPGEPGCFCGAGIGANTLVRMNAVQGGFNLRIRNLSNETETTLPPVNNYTQGGDVLIAPDGSRAVYALAQISNFGTPSQSVQTVIVLVDLLNLTQYALTAPADRLLRPLAWTEDDSAVLLADPTSMTTWKVTVRDGALESVANGIYLGTISGN